jgi:hypothetical protein
MSRSDAITRSFERGGVTILEVSGEVDGLTSDLLSRAVDRSWAASGGVDRRSVGGDVLWLGRAANSCRCR